MKKFLTLLLFLSVISSKVHADFIKDIKILNNKRISESTIITYGEIKTGKDYSDDQLNEIIKNLYKTNFFKNIDIKVDNGTLILTVEENKIIQSVLVEGIKSKRIQELILENLFSKDKSPFLEERVKQDQTKIRSSLNYQGYYLSKVESKIKENSNDTIDLIFVVDLGDKSLISQIEFVGDKKIKNRILRNIIISEEAKFWKFLSKNKFLNSNIIERDKRLLKNYYLDRGYYDVDIQSASVQFNDDKTFKLTYKINAGEKYFINTTKLELPIDYDPIYFKDVLEELSDIEKKPYSLNKISKVVDEIDKISLSRQYDFINADLFEEKIDNNKINLRIAVSESEKSYVEKINIYGNNVTYENVIRNQLEIDEGDPFNELLNAKSINNLRSINLFKEVETEVKDGEIPNTKVINITVDEKPTGEISLAAGAGTEGGTIGFGVSENNFLGKGIRLGSSLKLTEDSITGSFSVLNPNFQYSGKSLSTVVESTNIDKLTDNGYKTTKTGFSFGTGFEQFENVYFSPSISNYYEDLTTSSKASKNLKKQSGTYLESKFSYGLDYDMRNQKFQTSEGFRSKFFQSVPIYSDEYSFTNSYDFKTWYQLPNEMITSLSFFGKAVNSLNGEDVRITNRFYLPRNRLKGFKLRNMGPKDGKDYVGGNYAAAINFDTTLPMLFSSIESVDVRYFIDAANLWGVDYSEAVDQSNTIRSSTGLVFDWYTPVGPLNFSFTQDISKADSDKTESFQFNLGTTF